MAAREEEEASPVMAAREWEAADPAAEGSETEGYPGKALAAHLGGEVRAVGYQKADCREEQGESGDGCREEDSWVEKWKDPEYR